MKTKSKLQLGAQVWGIIVTSLLVLIFGVVMIDEITEKGPLDLNELSRAIINWYDDPTGFVFAYILGYAIVWWKPLWGSIIIMLGAILFVSINGFDGPPILAAPTFVVGLLYFVSWIDNSKKHIKTA